MNTLFLKLRNLYLQSDKLYVKLNFKYNFKIFIKNLIFTLKNEDFIFNLVRFIFKI